jgi:hypothetical protein
MLFYYCTLFLATVMLIYYSYKNDYQRIERYYFKHNRRLYYVLRATHFILLASIILNIRYVVYEYADDLLKSLKKRLSTS